MLVSCLRDWGNTGLWLMDPVDMTVTVGLGTGNKDQQSAFLIQVLNVQKEALMAGLPIANPKNVYNVANANTVTAVQVRSGASFNRPTSILPARLAEVSASYKF